MKEEVKNKTDFLKSLKEGEIVEGKIINKGQGAIFLDLGKQGTGIIYGKEFYDARNILKDLKIGDKLFAKIIDLDNEEGYVELSLSQAGQELSWEKLRLMKENDELIKVKILGANKGGLLAELDNTTGFLPVSQLSAEHYPRVEGGDTAKILKELQKFIGKELTVKILNLDQKTNQLIFSEKIIEREKIKEIISNYKVGDVVEGEITGILDFGAFIRFPLISEGKKDIRQLEGLIHISELDWRLIKDPAEIVKVGQIVKTKIIEITDDRIYLSLKALKEDPWQNIEKQHKKGDIILGKVTKFNPFGAFVQITPETQGLVHISEFGSQKKMKEKLEIGKEYEFEIILIDPLEHRMNLKLKQSEKPS